MISSQSEQRLLAAELTPLKHLLPVPQSPSLLIWSKSQALIADKKTQTLLRSELIQGDFPPLGLCVTLVPLSRIQVLAVLLVLQGPILQPAPPLMGTLLLVERCA
ncbi:hypothetical protein I305_03842 [Cryptococcus gattii E566]|uniref:Uncharacterized protein n=1 Tax=Cryptococcus gattii serotype B (strain WM276 / ATCC MYA-4071) TaxID=367775 RepID=E6R4K0_CRYGW|nr:Hypothetical Protein CGB_D7270C [Cryptococcus gattii WM276]ADV22057.1 Hypothetical Protein CGB_D7270C [Cryptococcus gattii WM276]KIY33452.1 hypothetical protein I305_03842 [Cryptococcus gattii E566]